MDSSSLLLCFACSLRCTMGSDLLHKRGGRLRAFGTRDVCWRASTRERLVYHRRRGDVVVEEFQIWQAGTK